jgi:hypothetical protein
MGSSKNNSKVLRPQTGLQVWRPWRPKTLGWMLIVLGKRLERLSEFLSGRILVFPNCKSISSGKTEDGENY